MDPFQVSCDNCIAGFGWLVIQRRLNGSVNFYRNWNEYKLGFGDLNGEFFIGLEKLRAITAVEPFELYIALEDFDGEKRHAKFDEFAIGSEEDDYALNVLGGYSGNAGDSLRSHRKMKFSTYDRDNDHEFARNCAFLHVGAWWYNQCVDSNLNGQYIDGGKYEEKLFARGMCWRAWRGHNYGYKFTQMMIRPKCRHFPATLKSHSNSFAEESQVLKNNGSQWERIVDKVEELISSLSSELNQIRDNSEKFVSQGYPPSCLAAMINTNGIHTIQVPGLEPFPVACETRLAGAGWTTIQRRQDGSENFYRSWAEYQEGFGNLSAEFFIGLEKLHAMTMAEPYELYIHLEDFDGESRYAKYDRFEIGNESDAFALRVLGKYSGDAGDSLRYHEGMPFSTFDNDHSQNHCALTNVGAWWYNYCHHSNLNGQYVEGGRYEVKLTGRGICWKSWRGYDYGYKLTQMMIRPRCRAASLTKP
ncbi:hypothetical protein ACLKA7_013392 [Drosophila subpalustris]